jgi:ComF family protein
MPPTALHRGGCARCLHESSWNVAGIARIGPYQQPLRSLITGLKYAGHERNADFAAALLAAAMKVAGWAGDIMGLVPVPMSWLRRLQRPCDHALLLATALGQRLGVRVANAAKRLKHTPSQTNQTSRHSRFANVKDCFGMTRGGERWVAGKTVCIVDNLVTSGATVCELSKVLRRAGAKKIYAAVIARTVLPGDPSAMTVGDVAQPEADRLVQ